MNLPCLLLNIFCSAGTVTGAAYVHDGDTIYIDRQAYRLAGIDAEELDEPHGLAARDHLRALTAGRIITCKWDGWSYNRRIAVCQDLNERMVKDGFALDCAHYSGGKYRSLEPKEARGRLRQKPYC